jgi:CBS-domain-containing membrane protein
MNFFNKEFRKISLENIDKSNMFWAWIGSFLGIIAISYFHMDILDDKDLTLVVGSFGASAVLIYGVPNSPLSQPRNLIGGHLLSAINEVAPPGGCKVRVNCIINIDVETAIAVAKNRFEEKSLYEITPTIADNKCPPIKFLG